MAIRKFYSSKAKPGWKWDARAEKYYSWGYDIDLEPTEFTPEGKPVRSRKRENGFAAKQLAEAAVARIVVNQKEKKYGFEEKPPLKQPTFAELCERRLPTIQDRHERVRATRVLGYFADLLPVNCRVAEIKSDHIILYRERRFADNLKASSVDREITIIAATLHEAPVFFAEELKDWNCPRIPRPKVEKSRRERLIMQDELQRILDELYRPQMENETAGRALNRRRAGLIFHFALLSGARIGEIQKLLKTAIDWQNNAVQIRGSKTRYRTAQTTRYLPITKTMRKILMEAYAVNPNDYAFTLTGSPVARYYENLREACRRAGVRYGSRVKGGLVTHDARHTFVTRALQSGKDLSSVGSITGQTDEILVKHYSHVNNNSRQQVMDVAENFAAWDFEKEKKAS